MKSQKIGLIFRFIMVSSFLLTGCSQATTPVATEISTMPPAAALPTDTQAPTLAPTTPTVENTPTLTMTPSPEPTLTATPVPTLGFTDTAISAWCLPENTSLTALLDPLSPPDSAKIGTFSEGVLQFDNLPVGACVVVYHMNMAAPSGLQLNINNNTLTNPWLSIELKPVESDPTSVYAQLTHSYIITPPYWNISYQFSVTDNSGTELRRDQVDLHRWKPKLCWNGRLPNVFTLTCPLKQDLHPWDAGYLTPIPTDEPVEK